ATSTVNVDSGNGNRTHSVVGEDAHITARTVEIVANYSNLNFNQEASASGGGLFGDADATADGTVQPDVAALVQGNATSHTSVIGTAGVDIRALNNIGNSYDLEASFFGIGDAHADVDYILTPSSRVDADSGVTIVAGPRLFPGDGVPPQDVTPLAQPA